MRGIELKAEVTMVNKPDIHSSCSVLMLAESAVGSYSLGTGTSNYIIMFQLLVLYNKLAPKLAA